MRRSAFAFLILAACGRAPDEVATRTSAGSATFSREAFAPRAGDAGAAEPPVPTTADPSALAEILAAAPKASARAPTGPDGGTAIGLETGIRDDAGAPSTIDAEPRKTSKVVVGKTQTAADVSDPAMEQALRAQVYFRLTQRCREGDRILPPEAVRIHFQLDADGYLVPPSILATAKEERFAGAARCMARELSTTTFRAPPAARGRAHTVDADVPSVD